MAGPEANPAHSEGEGASFGRGRTAYGALTCRHFCMNGRQFIVRARRWANARDIEVRFVASEGSGSHGTLYVGERKTTVKDRKKEIGKGLFAKMLADLRIEKKDF